MDLADELDAYVPRTVTERRDVARVHGLASTADPWSRALPLHVTGSAVVVHPPTGRVLLRWHERMEAWLHVGGHVDPDDAGPLDAARREGREETGLDDLAPWPDPDHPRLVHVVVVPVPAGRGEPAHEHADLRYVLATARPDDAVPERPAARLRWLPLDDAVAAVGQDNLRDTFARVAPLLDGADDRPPAP
ncbi:MAG: NUDIX domain-containing protein [Acidimicrobiales bacterium]|nr:NUDIX domain-containing protein [Acidimicrobiales bacterium]